MEKTRAMVFNLNSLKITDKIKSNKKFLDGAMIMMIHKTNGMSRAKMVISFQMMILKMKLDLKIMKDTSNLTNQNR